jgi:SAM-dependent methyltransferase
MRVSRDHGIRIRACDISPDRINTARLRACGIGLNIPFAVRNVYDLKPTSDAADLIICCEVIEHLENPNAALDVLASLAKPWLLVSVPREPLWRMLNMARGRYLNDFGNTPGHLSHFSTREFIKFLRHRVAIVEVRKPLPWTMVLCKSHQAETSPAVVPSALIPQEPFVTSEASCGTRVVDGFPATSLHYATRLG